MKRNVTFNFARGDKWSISIVGWENFEGWAWNVYLLLMPEHELYEKDLEFLPFRGGITYDKVHKESYFESKYAFKKDIEYRKAGSAYHYLYDDYSEYSAIDGIPAYIESDAIALKNQLDE